MKIVWPARTILDCSRNRGRIGWAVVEGVQRREAERVQRKCSLFSIDVIKHCPQDIIEGSQGRNSEQKPRRNLLAGSLTDTAADSCIASFLKQPRTTFPENSAT